MGYIEFIDLIGGKNSFFRSLESLQFDHQDTEGQTAAFNEHLKI